MKEFTVAAIAPDGARRVFLRTAETAESLAAALRAEGYVVLSIDEAAPGEDGRTPADVPGWHPSWLKGMTKFDVEMGLRQLASMLKSGITLLAALKTVGAQAASPRASLAWRRVAGKVYAGCSVAEALEADVRHFGDVAVRLAEVGEKSGELEKTLSRAADQMEARRNLKTAVMNAVMYPLVAISMAAAVSAFLVVSVIPKIADFLRSGNAALPAMTQMLVDVSDWFRANALSAAAWLAAAVAMWFVARMNDRAREAQDAFLLRLPVAGRILRLSGTALFARSMQILTESGVTLLDSLETSARLLPNRRLRLRIENVRSEVMRGSTLSKPLSAASEFMPMLSRMAAVGEKTGSLPEAFGETARFHEMLLALAVKRFGMLIEPVMILIAGGIVGFVYVAFFMALFSIAGAT